MTTERDIKAAAHYLKSRQGMEILDTGVDEYPHIVAKDGDTVVFVAVETGDFLTPLECHQNFRATAELCAAFWLEEYEGCDCQVRFDAVDMKRINSDRAFLRHTRDIYGGAV